jgi:hypothetical protein
VPAIRVFKLWRVRRALRVRQFVFELLVIKVLKGRKDNLLSSQLKAVWEFLKDAAVPITVEDPANPTGNDLSPLLDSGIWSELQQASTATLDLIASSGWEAVFGPVTSAVEDKTEKLRRAAASVTVPTKPWLSD